MDAEPWAHPSKAGVTFPRIGNGQGVFFQALEKSALISSKAWKIGLLFFQGLEKLPAMTYHGAKR
jgi:hypothetical protein